MRGTIFLRNCIVLHFLNPFSPSIPPKFTANPQKFGGNFCL